MGVSACVCWHWQVLRVLHMTFEDGKMFYALFGIIDADFSGDVDIWVCTAHVTREGRCVCLSWRPIGAAPSRTISQLPPCSRVVPIVNHRLYLESSLAGVRGLLRADAEFVHSKVREAGVTFMCRCHVHGVLPAPRCSCLMFNVVLVFQVIQTA